jgi:hypothetical protein
VTSCQASSSVYQIKVRLKLTDHAAEAGGISRC